MVLIDAVREESIFLVNKLREEGYSFKGIFIEHEVLSASKMSVIAMPGHTEGGVCLYHPAN